MPDIPSSKIVPKTYTCYRACSPITIDGKLNDPSWIRAPRTDLFVDIEGDLKPIPRFGTRAMMVWDDNYFYVAADLEEPDIWGTLTKRDSVICLDNDFEVFLDPDGDTNHYMEFEINALNTAWDYAGVDCPPRAGHSWRVNFSRVEWDFDRYKDGYLRKDGPPCDNWVWSPQGVINMHIPEMWGHVIFSDVVVGTKEM